MDARPVERNDADAVEAARYALLRRLMPSLRHGMVGALHPIELIVEAIERRLQAAAPDLAAARENLGKIKNLSRSAVLYCTNLASWLAPEEGAAISPGEGIDECLAMVKTDFGMRGFALHYQAREIGVDVSRAALRNVLTASLMAATDSAPHAVDLVLTAELTQGYVLVSILVRPAQGGPGFADGAVYRRLAWSDVDALARAESVELSRQGDRISIRFAALAAVAQRGSPPR
jgi:hypothetical protein